MFEPSEKVFLFPIVNQDLEVAAREQFIPLLVLTDRLSGVRFGLVKGASRETELNLFLAGYGIDSYFTYWTDERELYEVKVEGREEPKRVSERAVPEVLQGDEGTLVLYLEAESGIRQAFPRLVEKEAVR